MVVEIGSGYSLYDIIVTAITVFSLSMEIYLIYLIVYKSPKCMARYRFFLLSISLWDSTFSFAFGLGLMPNMLYPTSCVVVNGFFKFFGARFSLVMVSFVTFCAYNGKMAQDYCMMYRLTIIMESNRIHETFLRLPCVILFQIVMFCVSFTAAIFAYFSFMDDSLAYLDRFPSESGKTEEWRIPQFNRNAVMVCTAWFDKSLTNMVTLSVWILGISEVLCFLMAASIFFILRKNISRFSKKTYAMHMQLTLLIVMQYISPIFFMFGPVSIILVRQFIQVNDPPQNSFGDFLGTSCSLYGCANTCLTLIFVTPYRRYTCEKLLSLFTRLRSRKVASLQRVAASA
ncbi:serpentine type 7TM GPCR chemoreceptor srh domain-containing protein [Ditylenchus destructor]|nr:serpentine type 7TM GPCR chemoreceptor srh domain-containing protein [Ditylenchus destructor]